MAILFLSAHPAGPAPASLTQDSQDFLHTCPGPSF